ncbi:NEDD8 [Wickerhamiella sorbophila]|uniref:NEDD8 n=1 Tax=Wickerhamiella sorbophila TaxID=45607 RepID=A0A2T0FNS1_9ASCO|nr:NEDD8 [Wickerhamiella sorbophila]PRT56628.1 NEDD8 [Wickerhamiella sorbophila]
MVLLQAVQQKKRVFYRIVDLFITGRSWSGPHQVSTGLLTSLLVVTMKISVKTLVGKELALDVEPSEKVHVIKERIEEKEGIPPEQQRLIHNGKQIDDNLPISQYNFTEGTKLHLALSLRGGY